MAVALAWASWAGVALAAPRADRTAAGSAVRVMVVGQRAVLERASTVRASATDVAVGHRRCRVAAGTPLAALAALRRAGGPAFSLVDFARCSKRSARDAAGLFVRRIGPDANRGQDGWVYKVDDRAGTAGAGDESGPFGDGRRLARGQRLEWFYCHMGPAGCQRTLTLLPATARVAPGASLEVAVRAYDDRGRAIPAAGATVSFGAATAVTGADGRATLTAPAATGTAVLTATDPPAVPAFPVVERVG